MGRPVRYGYLDMIAKIDGLIDSRLNSSDASSCASGHPRSRAQDHGAGGARRQERQGDVVQHLEFRRHMPSGLIKMSTACAPSSTLRLISARCSRIASVSQ